MDDELFSASTEDEIIKRTWQKLERNLKKEGYRAGAAKGQEESYQNGFDLGYSEGFRIGECLGLHKGSSSLRNVIGSEIPNINTTHEKQLLEDHERDRACILCHKEGLSVDKQDSITIEKILEKQRQTNDAIIHMLTYSNVNR